jgi:F-type H+-transporting ATPase subunit a
MEMTPDDTIVFVLGGFAINATILFTWVVMAFLTLASILITRNLRPDVPPDRWRTTLEAIVLTIQGQIDEISTRPDRRLLYFSGTLFLFIITCNLLMIVPGWRSPTGSLSTTAALAL